jgi:hypothetical protein
VDPAVPEQRILEASAALPAIGAVTGWAACRLHGAAFHDGLARDGRTPLAVPLALGPRGWLQLPDGTVADYSLPAPTAWHTIAGVRVLDPVRATFDAMKAARSDPEIVVELEKSVMAEIVSIEQVKSYAEARRGAHGRTRILAAIPLAREHARSPQETRTRLIAETVAGMSGLWVNPILYNTNGEKIGEVDLLDPETGTVMEYNGDDHEEGPRRHRDALKGEAIRRAGAELLWVTPKQLHEPEALAQRMRDAQARAREVPPHRKRWSAVPKVADLDARLRAAREYASYLQAVSAQVP